MGKVLEIGDCVRVDSIKTNTVIFKGICLWKRDVSWLIPIYHTRLWTRESYNHLEVHLPFDVEYCSASLS